MENDVLRIAGREFHSRLIIGTGKYRSFQEMARAHEASGAEMVTVAVRRVNLTDRSKESLLDYIDRKKLFILPNTAGCYTADEAIRTARLAREVGLSNWIKLEVIGDEKTLFPDNFELVRATEVLAKEGFVVMPYTNDDLISARRLDRCGRGGSDAAGSAHRLRPGHSESHQHTHPARDDHQRSPDHRCRGGNGVRRSLCHGIGRRCGADEHRNRRRAGPHPDGASNEERRDRRPPGLPRRPHAQRNFTPPLPVRWKAWCDKRRLLPNPIDCEQSRTRQRL